MTWTKQNAREYHKKWRQENAAQWKLLLAVQRQKDRELKLSDPLEYRKRHCKALYGVEDANSITWNDLCPITGGRIDYSFERTAWRGAKPALITDASGNLAMVTRVGLKRMKNRGM